MPRALLAVLLWSGTELAVVAQATCSGAQQREILMGFFVGLCVPRACVAPARNYARVTGPLSRDAVCLSATGINSCDVGSGQRTLTFGGNRHSVAVPAC